MNPDDKNPVKAILDEFFETASKEDLLELQALLEERSRKRSSEAFNPNKIASNLANGLRTRMGITSEQITRTARDAVRTMILQYDPHIPEEQLQALLDKWVPGKKKPGKGIPTDVMRAMISQFTAYGRGELTEDQLKDFPKGWAKKYWASFPEGIQGLIEAYIRNRIGRDFFLESIEILLKKKY